MENPFYCFFPPYDPCDGCGKCIEEYEKSCINYEDYEPSDDDLDAYIEKQIIVEENRE